MGTVGELFAQNVIDRNEASKPICILIFLGRRDDVQQNPKVALYNMSPIVNLRRNGRKISLRNECSIFPIIFKATYVRSGIMTEPAY